MNNKSNFAINEIQSFSIFNLLGKFSGRVMLLHSLVFMLMVFMGGGLSPDIEVIQSLGGRDPVYISKGYVWLLFSSIFVCVGLVHFFVCLVGIYIVGQRVEKALGGVFFLAIYLLSGFFGNVLSLIVSTNVGVGSSAGLFGLIGAWWFLDSDKEEKLIKKVSFNNSNMQILCIGLMLCSVVLGFISPLVDHVSHLGGLVAGVLLAYICCFFKEKRQENMPIKQFNKITYSAIFALSAFLIFAIHPSLVSKRLVKNGDEFFALYEQRDKQNTYAEYALYHYSRALEIDSDNKLILFRRGKILYRQNKVQEALDDFRMLLGDKDYQNKLEDFADKFSKEGQPVLAIYSLLNHRSLL